MSVETQDLSNYGGAPVMLYEFSRRSIPTLTGTPVVTYWRFTSADRDFTLDANVYTAVAIADDGVRQSGDATADQLTITMPYDSAVPQMYIGSAPSDPIMCVIRHANVGETDSYLVWAGVIAAVTRTPDPETSSLTTAVLCSTITATMDRTGLRLAWSRNCPHDLYGFECKASAPSFVTTDTITTLDGIHVTCAAFAGMAPPRSLAGGFLEWIDGDGHAERLGIIEHPVDDGTHLSTDTITVLGTTDKLIVGQTVHAFLGCNRLRTTCNGVFNNLPNHGGHAYMPDVNPFSGDLIF